MSDRVLAEMKRENCSKATALYNLKKDDEERRKWSLQLYGKDTWDSSLYDMVFCVDSLTVDNIVEILASAIREKQFQETQESLAELQKRALLANISAFVSPISPHTKVELLPHSSIELTNMDGRLRSDQTARQEFTSKMRKEFNIQEVFFREPVQPYKGYINPFYNLDVH